jgi:decaprenylphospho-beta-D-erythro-pentofuranosid-2-ulose 2-reductase
LKKILIIGASSAIAQATARNWAKQQAAFYLVGRDTTKLERIAQDLLVRGANKVNICTVDFMDITQHRSVIEDACGSLGNLDITLLTHGSLTDQLRAEQDNQYAVEETTLNFSTAVSFLTLVASRMEIQGQGAIAVIGSVAGDRGRASNYVYGSAKAGLAAFTQGLRQRLSKSKVQVLLIKPGFVDTPMTQEFKKGFLWASPDQVAKDICKAVEKKKNVLYTPWFWGWIMLIIQHIPESIFKRLKL